LVGERRAVEGGVLVFVARAFGDYQDARVVKKVRVELRAARVLHAVDGPRAAVVSEVFRLGGMPVAALVDRLAAFEKLFDESVERRDHLVAALDGERAAGAEVVLHVNDYERATLPSFFLHQLPPSANHRAP